MAAKLHIAITGLEGQTVFSAPFELLATELAPRLCRRGHQVTVYRIAHSAPAGIPVPNGLTEVALPGAAATLGQSLVTNFFSMIQASLSSADVLLQVHAGGGWFQWLPRLLGKRTVLQTAGLDSFDRRRGPLASAWLKHATAVGCRLASKVVVDCEHAGRVYERRFGKRCEVINYGANVITSTDPFLLAPLGLVSAGYYLCAADLLSPDRAELVAEAFSRSESPRPLVVMVRPDSAHDQAAEGNPTAVFQKKLGKRTKVIAATPESTLWRELLVHAFAYFHSDWPVQVHPMLLNVLAAGTCVLAEDNPYSREVLAEGIYGLLWNPMLASLSGRIRQLERDLSVPARFRRLAKRRIQERYSWEQVTDEYERLFMQVCSAPEQ